MTVRKVLPPCVGDDEMCAQLELGRLIVEYQCGKEALTQEERAEAITRVLRHLLTPSGRGLLRAQPALWASLLRQIDVLLVEARAYGLKKFETVLSESRLALVV